jgi:hypothetical protein
MEMITADVNWAAVALGTVLAFALGMLWFGPVMFGKIWSRGSHDLKPPASLPLGAMATTLVGTFLMAWAIGVTATSDNLGLAVMIILAIALLQLGMALFSQKSLGAALADGGYLIAMGALMIIAQGVL